MRLDGTRPAGNDGGEIGIPAGGAGRVDTVGGSGIHPASAGTAPAGAEVRTTGELVAGAGGEPGGRSEALHVSADIRSVAGGLRRGITRAGELVLALAAGAALMYVFDPRAGRRRRKLMRDKMVHAGHELRELEEAAEARARDLRNRARGMAAEVRSRFSHQLVDDSILEARVRSELGHVLANAGSIDITATDGCVTLAGPVLANEVNRLIATVQAVPGVHEIINRLNVSGTPGGIPGLQGQPDPGAIH